MRAGTPPSRTYSERYGARSPWLAPRWRAAVYLIWRALFALVRPALFLALCAGALISVYRALEAAPADSLRAPQTLSEQFDAALNAAVPAQDAEDTLSRWRTEIEQSLAPTLPGPPDLPRARSFASSLPALMGREALALYLMQNERRPELMRADLAAMPVWRREQIINGVLEGRQQSEGLVGEPVWLREASPRAQQRYRRAQALYERSFQAAESWFHSPDGLALNLAALPGLAPGLSPSQARVLPDARELIVQGCALARAQSQRVPACERAQLVLPEADPVRAALALSLHDPALDPATVRLALAARAAGRLDGEWLASLMLGPPAREREMRLLTALMPILADADQIHARPATCHARCAAAMAELHAMAGLDDGRRQSWFAAFEEIRRNEDALVALRVSDVLDSRDDVQVLARLSAISEGRMLAGRILLAEEMVTLSPSESFFRTDFDRPQLLLAALLALLAVAMLGIVLISGRIRRSGGSPGALERLDAEISRLILGRNI
ncbi:hypothetical protein [Oceanicaulis sp. MMSF_3324]|uniref:hypothetical protein n=1 Tax=Oceanicaulis sp. MMSF_3324 TaxID=3046702 RepID=UPI00273DAE69|nr:hypothetical protein [Oceanicaulis sp. MMSF_3324]